MKNPSSVIFALLSFVTTPEALANPAKQDWSQELLVKTCAQVVREQVAKESQFGEKVSLEVLRASAQMTTDHAFACLVVGERVVRSGATYRHERRAYSASVTPWPKLQYRVQEITL